MISSDKDSNDSVDCALIILDLLLLLLMLLELGMSFSLGEGSSWKVLSTGVCCCCCGPFLPLGEVRCFPDTEQDKNFSDSLLKNHAKNKMFMLLEKEESYELM